MTVHVISVQINLKIKRFFVNNSLLVLINRYWWSDYPKSSTSKPNFLIHVINSRSRFNIKSNPLIIELVPLKIVSVSGWSHQKLLSKKILGQPVVFKTSQTFTYNLISLWKTNFIECCVNNTLKCLMLKLGPWLS